MALSEREQKILEELENQLRAEEPRLAGAFAQQQGSRPVTPREWGVMAAGVLLGACALAAGVFFKSILLGVLGFLLVAAGLYVVLGRSERDRARLRRGQALPAASGRGASRNDAGSGALPWGAGGRSAAPDRARRQSGFMKRLEDRWDERH